MNRRGFFGKLALLPLALKVFPALAEKSKPGAIKHGDVIVNHCRTNPNGVTYTSERVELEGLEEFRPGLYKGTLAYSPIRPGSVEMVYMDGDGVARVIRDDGGGILKDRDLYTGLVSYTDGTYVIRFRKPVAFPAMSYDFEV